VVVVLRCCHAACSSSLALLSWQSLLGLEPPKPLLLLLLLLQVLLLLVVGGSSLHCSSLVFQHGLLLCRCCHLLLLVLLHARGQPPPTASSPQCSGCRRHAACTTPGCAGATQAMQAVAHCASSHQVTRRRWGPNRCCRT
jgi:hypothetical protein